MMEPYEPDEEAIQDMIIVEDKDPLDDNETLMFEEPIDDILINTECNLPLKNQLHPAIVKKRSIDKDGREIGMFDPNPVLNTVLYDVEFNDGSVRQYTANMIAQNLVDQVDNYGYSLSRLEAIVDYRKDKSALTKDQINFKTKSGKSRSRKSTKGWKMLVQFSDGSRQWVPLKILKEINPVEVAEFACARGIEKDPAFGYWVPYTLRKRDAIVSSITHRFRKTTHKYGIKTPHAVDDS